eukprot:TRINITY_DN1792_c0_g1_i2.p2 TRINITY_DN1792_c0_g1~~TRINITY_DN1792_c0_g1_i2.p2  ORF type:complete len:462 (+),score=120.15 TRINITY_DN1792_c0_g1_i2:65-1450(+)
MTRGMSHMGTYRRGRTVYVPDHVRAMENKCGGGCVAFLACLFLAGVPVALFAAEANLLGHKKAFQEVGDNYVTVNPYADKATMMQHGDRLVHLPGAEVESTVHEHDFSFVAPGLTLRRHTEYCQWQEHSTTTCQRCADGTDRNGNTKYRDCNCVRQYHYTLGWRSHRIQSLIFDQPAAHHNPQRDPFPSRTIVSKDAALSPSGVGLVPILGEGRLLASSQPLAFAPGGVRPPYSWWEHKMHEWFGWQDVTLYGSLEEIRDLPHSNAGRENFRYVGNGGYFFSPHQPSGMESFFRLTGQLLEGSLLDWQIGDIIPSCHAGDIRVHFSVTNPSMVSAAGQLTTARSGQPILVPFPTAQSYHIGMVQQGSLSFKDMADADIWEQKKWAIFIRILTLPWAYVLAVALARQGTEVHVLGCFGMAGALLAFCQIVSGGFGMWTALLALVSVGLVAGTAPARTAEKNK